MKAVSVALGGLVVAVLVLTALLLALDYRGDALVLSVLILALPVADFTATALLVWLFLADGSRSWLLALMAGTAGAVTVSMLPAVYLAIGVLTGNRASSEVAVDLIGFSIVLAGMTPIVKASVFVALWLRARGRPPLMRRRTDLP